VDGRVNGIDGGILGLLELVKKYREAIHYDLLPLGVYLRHVGTQRFGWDDFAIWVKFMPTSSQLYQAVHGPQWSPELHMLANIFDTLASGNWQRGGGKGPRPKPVKRPRVDKNVQTFGKPKAFADVQQFLVDLNGRAPGGA